ncbi:MAG: sodium:solute symporter [Flavobacteriaceae bacterium]|nr:sodium:solute symporter [Flavobacteriaceae bacterium]OUX39158.1 MAG: sodium:solute symporter [Flavobacteriaceae bacterium TMED265]
MSSVDWIVLCSTLTFIVVYGIYKSTSKASAENYLRGKEGSKWWTIGLSVMATQASAITFLSTPGQAFHDGLGFVQFYFGLPIAMVVISKFFVPYYYKQNVFTAYELLENRFDKSTRTLTAILFLIQRGMAAGITIFAPSIILSAVLGWDLRLLNVVIGSIVVLYTVLGGTAAVNITQKQQMTVIFTGLLFVFFYLFQLMPDYVSSNRVFEIAKINSKLNALDFSIDPKNRYTFWSGITGGFFLALAYFGTDQSQVQRYLSGNSVKESQWGLFFNGIFKIPLQLFILLIGVLVFVFYQFNSSPLHFNPSVEKMIQNSIYASDYEVLQNEYEQIELKRHEIYASSSAVEEQKEDLLALNTAEKALRAQTKTIATKIDQDAVVNDKDYVFIHFILTQLPIGLIGLLLAVILSAAMSSTASELNALGVTTAIDIYGLHSGKEKTKEGLAKHTKVFTFFWGIVAIFIASIANLFDNLIQMVNIIGSLFYGNVLGIFLVAFFLKHISAKAVFNAAILTQIAVFVIFFIDIVGYLWLNAIGCLLLVLTATSLQFISKRT